MEGKNESKHTPEYRKLLLKLEAYGEANDLLKQEASELRAEVDRLKMVIEKMKSENK